MEQNYAVIDSDGNVVSVIVWDGTWYDPDTNPRGLMKNGEVYDNDGNPHLYGDCTLIAVPEDVVDDNFAETGGTYDAQTDTFTRPDYVAPTPPSVQFSGDTAVLFQALVDQGIITADDIASAATATPAVIQVDPVQIDPVVVDRAQ